MKRRLIVMRHAKSAWDTDASTNRERPLNKRGRRDAPRIARRLADLGWAPDLVLSSDALRTRQTWELMREGLGPVDARFLSSLYGAGVRTVRAELAEVPDETAAVMVLGHNPGWEEVVQHFSGRAERLTTANAALLDLEAVSWAQAGAARAEWRLDRVLRPKEL